MLPHSDPDRWRDLSDRKAMRDDEFRRGLISETVYITRLGIYGYTPRMARTELSLLKSQMLDAKNLSERMTKIGRKI